MTSMTLQVGQGVTGPVGSAAAAAGGGADSGDGFFSPQAAASTREASMQQRMEERIESPMVMDGQMLEIACAKTSRRN